MRAIRKIRLMLGFFIVTSGLSPFALVAQTATQLTIDASQSLGAIDLTRFSLGQGGLSAKPMFDDKINEIKAIHPAYIRIFLQEYYHFLPAANTYHWGSLDTMLDLITAVGAQPILDICFKPKVLYPVIDQRITIPPNGWTGWDTLCYRLAKHCLDKNYGVKYWEIGNEVDIGDGGGCPYQCTSADYKQWYTHTANSIKKADPTAKVGGPALCCPYNGSIGTDLIAYCANGNAPLDFYSWHAYGGDGGSTATIKQLLASYPSLRNVETMITEWNSGVAPGMGADQPPFVLEQTKAFLQAGLTISAYYHIRDYKVDINEFSDFMSPSAAQFMADWWNGSTDRGGLFGFNGNMYPVYYVFLWLSKMKGTQLKSTCGTGDIRSWAVKNGNSTYVIFWNYGGGTSYNVTITLPGTTAGTFVLKRLNCTTVKADSLRGGTVQSLSTTPLTISLPRYGIGWLEIVPNQTAMKPRVWDRMPAAGYPATLYDLRGRHTGRMIHANAGMDAYAAGARGIFLSVAQNRITRLVVK